LRNALRFRLLAREASPPAEECRNGRQVEVERCVEIRSLLVSSLAGSSHDLQVRAVRGSSRCPHAARSPTEPIRV
jgi:hypothetical protein